jgi:DNA-binding LacI/PurR family transcriptional regulator
VFAANDQMALGLMRALHERGVSIPGEVSVVGFDDMAEAKAFWPPLTTVHQDFAEIGRRSIQMLLHEIEDSSRDVGTTIVPTRLVVRESTAAPRS